MKRLSPILVFLAMIAALFHSGPQQALACSCEYGPHADETYARQYLDGSEIVVVGTVDRWEPSEPDTGYTTIAYISVERVYRGPAARDLVVHTHDSVGCGYEEALREGGRHLLSLRSGEGGRLGASYCSSWRLPQTDTPIGERGQLMLEFLSLLGESADHGPPRWVVPGFLAGGVLALGGLILWSRAAAECRQQQQPDP
jgi:hypothetical protein